jgi:hypothetical protein
MAVTITKLGNQAKVDNGGSEKKYFDAVAMANSFTIDETTLIVSSRLLDSWATPAPLSEFTIAGNSGMTTVAQFSDALQDLTSLNTS